MIVNRSFVNEVIGDGTRTRAARAVHRRGESPQAAGPRRRWYEIVGVVEEFPANNDGPMLYHPLTRASIRSA